MGKRRLDMANIMSSVDQKDVSEMHAFLDNMRAHHNEALQKANALKPKPEEKVCGVPIMKIPDESYPAYEVYLKRGYIGGCWLQLPKLPADPNRDNVTCFQIL